MFAQRVGERLFTLILLTLVLSAIAVTYQSTQMDDVRILLRSDDGGRGVYTLSLSSGALQSDETSRQTTNSGGKFVLSDGSVLALEPAGIVRHGADQSFSLLVASTVSPSPRTPLAIWHDGQRIAWLNPADGSLQVYEKTPRDTYAPLLVQKDLLPSSIQFSEDGNTLILTKLSAGMTDFYTLTLRSGEVQKRTSVTGFATLTQTP